jgi:predicted DsbA family dithiol-disulfide isomerase
MFLFGGKVGVSGAQETEYLAEAIDRLAAGSDAAE